MRLTQKRPGRQAPGRDFHWENALTSFLGIVVEQQLMDIKRPRKIPTPIAWGFP